MNKLIVLSGGQDSATCLALAIAKGHQVRAIAFNYNQRHEVELVCASELCATHEVELVEVDLPDLREITESALLDNTTDVGGAHRLKRGLPASFVPGRNALFLTLAHAHAQSIGAGAIVTGVCETDYSGYPDCREQFIEKMQSALNQGYESAIAIETPLMHLTKAETWALAELCGEPWLQEVRDRTHTCYNGGRMRFPWGHGCSDCPSCKLRARGYSEFTAGEYNQERVATVFNA